MAGCYWSLHWYLSCIHSQACLLLCLTSSGLAFSFCSLFYHFYNTAMAVFFLCVLNRGLMPVFSIFFYIVNDEFHNVKPSCCSVEKIIS